MTLPLNADVSGGITKSRVLGNAIAGDCTVAAFYHIVMCLARVRAGFFKRWMYRLGFVIPDTQFALAEYDGYLYSIGQKPSSDPGVDPAGWLAWQQGQGNVLGWKQLPNMTEDSLRQAMIDFGGVMLGGSLSNNSYHHWGPKILWRYSLAVADQPNPSLGHMIAFVKYGPSFDTAITWGQFQRMTLEYRLKCFTYAFVFVFKTDPNATAKLAILATL